MRRAVIVFAIVAALDPGHAQGHAETLAPAEVDRLLDRLVTATASVRDYVCTFTKEERVDGDLQPMDTILIKQRREPRCAYLKWIGGEDKGREAIYCPPRYGTDFKVHEGSGIKSWMTLSLDPNGRLAMQGERHPISEAGIYFAIEQIEHHFQADRARLRFERGARPDCIVATQTAPTGHYAYRTEICVDPERSLPTSIEVHDSDGALLERYVYSDCRWNAGLDDRDFDVKNPDYRF